MEWSVCIPSSRSATFRWCSASGSPQHEILAGWRRSAAAGGRLCTAVDAGLPGAGRAVLCVNCSSASRSQASCSRPSTTCTPFWTTCRPWSATGTAISATALSTKPACAMFGRSPEAIAACTAREVLGEQGLRFVRPYVEQACKGHPQLFERTLTDASGQLRHTHMSLHPGPGDRRRPGTRHLRADDRHHRAQAHGR